MGNPKFSEALNFYLGLINVASFTNPLHFSIFLYLLFTFFLSYFLVRFQASSHVRTTIYSTSIMLEGNCECGNKLSGSIKCGEFLA